MIADLGPERMDLALNPLHLFFLEVVLEQFILVALDPLLVSDRVESRTLDQHSLALQPVPSFSEFVVSLSLPLELLFRKFLRLSP